MGSAKEFLKKMQFVEEMDAGDSEMVADKGHSREMQEDDEVPEAPPVVDTDDDQILAVMNNYFKHINSLPADQKSDKLQDLTHRMANVMLNMPSGEKELRKSLKGAANGLEPIAPAPADEGKKKRKIGEKLGTSPAAKLLNGLISQVDTDMEKLSRSAKALLDAVKRTHEVTSDAHALEQDMGNVTIQDLVKNVSDAKVNLLAGIEQSIDESEQSDQMASKIDGLKKQKDDAKAELDRDPKGSGAESSKSRIADIEKQIQELEAQKKSQANEAKKPAKKPVAKKKK